MFEIFTQTGMWTTELHGTPLVKAAQLQERLHDAADGSAWSWAGC
jgi:hypothetical protein